MIYNSLGVVNWVVNWLATGCLLVNDWLATGHPPSRQVFRTVAARAVLGGSMWGPGAPPGNAMERIATLTDSAGRTTRRWNTGRSGTQRTSRPKWPMECANTHTRRANNPYHNPRAQKKTLPTEKLA